MKDAEGAWAVGLMSGTSADGIDAALLRSDGERIHALGPALTLPYAPAFRARLVACFGGAGDTAVVERELTELHAEAVAALLGKAGMRPKDVRVIGFHGQTIRHAPREGRTWQIGDGALLAALSGIDVVNDFRSSDVAAGGEGAPLVPVFHRALAADLEKPLAVLNIGGVANVTWIGEDGVLLAFDTGPGNALLDDWAMRHLREPLDRDGALAAGGSIDAAVLAALLAHPYFARKPPKSLDRDAFPLSGLEGLAPADGAATLAAFTVAAIARAVEHFPAPPLRWLVAGGGRRNPALMRGLRAALTAPLAAIEAAGWDGDQVEAQAFAYLALRALAGMPISFPATTGAPRPLTGGRVHRHAIMSGSRS